MSGAITVSLSAGGQRSTGTVIGSDPGADLALVRSSRPLTGHQFSLATGYPQVGTRVAAIGFPVGDPITMTQGGVSAIDPSITVQGLHLDHLIETDAPLNPGNSGGPLITGDGNVAGLVDAANTQAAGIGYAIPASSAAAEFTTWSANPQPEKPAASCAQAGGPTSEPAPSIPVDGGAQLPQDDAAGIGEELAAYFAGINTGNYTQAWSMLSPRVQSGGSYDAFARGLTSSFDSGFRVLSVSSVDADHVVVGLAFTSIQAPDQGPNGDACDNWTLDYSMLRTSAGWRLDGTAAHGASMHTAC